MNVDHAISLEHEQNLNPFIERHGCTLIHGDSMQVMERLPAGSFDAVIADPPYCSGGTTAGERRRAPEDKYSQDGKLCGRCSNIGMTVSVPKHDNPTLFQLNCEYGARLLMKR